METEILDILKKYWGHKSFRPLQEEIIQSVLSGQDTIALLPTGGGKSVCFQVPAMAREGVCLVISPLIALMQDQVRNLRAKGIKASALVGGMSKRELDETLDNAVYGNVKFLYVSPERLRTGLFLARLEKMKVGMVAVDEAHCISEWGHDFRPPYRQIAEIREYLPKVPFIALTATATPDVISDIAALLQLDQPAIFKKSFVRENLIYVVQEEHHKLNRMIGAVKNLGGSGIVYVGTRRETVRQANLLRANNIGALPYHGGMSREDRKKTQEMWINNKAAVVVATNAFGMGIDKPDVRFVIHLDLPASPEAYFQEAGRAGRDGKRAYAVCLVNEEDRLALKERVERQIPHKKDIKTVFRALVNYFQLATGSSMEGEHPFNLVAFSKRYNLEPANTLNCLKVLQEEEYVHLTDAVFNPSKVQVLQNTKDLYSFEIGHPKFEPIIRVLLRSYEGLFDQPVRIDEMALARRLKSNYGKVREMLEYLAQMRVISYRPHTDLPFISFPIQRPSVERLKLDDKALKARQDRLLSKMQSILRYSRNDIVCRSRQLVSYFGDYSASDCGKCDVCLAKKKIQSEKELNPNLFAEIKSSLQDNPKSLEEISQIPGFKTEEISNALRWLNDNGEIQIDLENVVSKAH